MAGKQNTQLWGPGAEVEPGEVSTKYSSQTRPLAQDLSAADWIALLNSAKHIFGQAETRILWRSSPLPQPPELPLIESMFVDECLERKIGCSISAGDLYQHYCSWCRGNGYEPKSVQRLGRALTKHGFSRRKKSQIRYKNIRIRRAGQGVA